MLCEVEGGVFKENSETIGFDYFTKDNLPILATEKNNEEQRASGNWCSFFISIVSGSHLICFLERSAKMIHVVKSGVIRDCGYFFFCIYQKKCCLFKAIVDKILNRCQFKIILKKMKGSTLADICSSGNILKCYIFRIMCMNVLHHQLKPCSGNYSAHVFKLIKSQIF